MQINGLSTEIVVFLEAKWRFEWMTEYV